MFSDHHPGFLHHQHIPASIIDSTHAFIYQRLVGFGVYEVYMCNTVMLYVVVLCYMLCRCSSDTSTVGWEELHFNLKTPIQMLLHLSINEDKCIMMLTWVVFQEITLLRDISWKARGQAPRAASHKQLSNHSTPRSYRSIIQSQHNTSYFEIKAGLKALEFGVMFSFATDNCVLSVVFSSVVFYAFLRFSFWLCGCFLFFVSCLNFRLGAVALCVRHWVCVGGVGGCAHPLSLPW